MYAYVQLEMILPVSENGCTNLYILPTHLSREWDCRLIIYLFQNHVCCFFVFFKAGYYFELGYTDFFPPIPVPSTTGDDTLWFALDRPWLYQAHSMLFLHNIY